MQKKIGVYSFEYELKTTGDLNLFKANIAAVNFEDAEQELRDTVGDVNVRTTGFECRLDAISKKLKELINPKKNPGRPRGSKNKKG